MAPTTTLIVICITCFLSAIASFPSPHLKLSMAASSSSHLSTLETFIVHTMAHMKPSHFGSHSSWHASLLSSVMEPSSTDPAAASPAAEDRMLYSYGITGLHGFAARMTAVEAAKLQKMGAVGMARKDRILQVHTTRTPQFLGLASSSNGSKGLLWQAANQGEDVIVGVLDTGIWPERRSYDDTGFSEVPARWNGTCESGPGFNSSVCNRKLIGGKAFYKGYEAYAGKINETLEFKSARDGEGHGTHTSSTAAGSAVQNASLSGYASGTASGISPLSRIAMYKVCWLQGCFDSDMLAAFEAAISDGVDVISVSIGSGSEDYFQDSIAVGTFAAMANGITTSCSAGNSGPDSGTVVNVAPWILTVAASSIDRDFPAPAILGNGKTFKGESLFPPQRKQTDQVPLVYAGSAVVNGGNETLAGLCASVEDIDASIVNGKMVLCDRGLTSRASKGYIVEVVGGVGMILGNDEGSGEELAADYHILPATEIGFNEAEAIKQYINSTANPTASIEFNGTKVRVRPAPIMTAFSSRGPNTVTPEILKPDITAPGLNILAAWTGATGATDIPDDQRRVEFNIISGTSMSCPHVAGVTALLRAAHPSWTPAAIKSAIMTSATTVDNTGKPITDSITGAAADPTVYGAGHVHPNAALNPGLIYDITPQDYLDFLCSLNYTSDMLSVFVSSYDCNKSSISKPGDLNYPSFSAVLKQNERSSYTETFTRTLTNVGSPNSTYTVSVTPPKYVNVTVKPSTLSFDHVDQKMSYSITLSAEVLSTVPENGQEVLYFGSLVWSDGHHTVQSPISFMWQI